MGKRAEAKREKSKQLAITLRAEMHKLGLTLRQLESKTNLNYEHLRRVFLGEAYPSDDELNFICKILNLPADKMAHLMLQDQIYNDYGIVLGDIPERPPMPPDLTLLASDWNSLTPDQQVSFVVQVQAVAEHNRKHKSKK